MFKTFLLFFEMFTKLSIFFVLNIIPGVINIQISTPAGQLVGSELSSRLGKTIYSFRGIPFAVPPINELRFKPPVPFKRWTGVYNATVDAPACTQPRLSGIDIPSSEDCLFLNVYTTKLPSVKKGNPKRPVIVYIYGGSFVLGTGRSDVTGPQYFMDQDIVLVTFNYRLASLGFIALGKEAPGNNGFKDQNLAMRWTKNNIEAFGGDPNSITLYGHSAGACSVTLHLTSPMSRGLFHKAIFSSCSAFGAVPITTNLTDLAKKQARFVGCPDDTSERILNCLRTKPAQEIADTLPKFWEFGMDPVLIWYPVIERDYGQERFLIEHPIKSVVNGNFYRVPILAGITKDEVADRAIPVTSNQTLLQILNDNFDKYAPIIFSYERETSKSKEVSDRIRQFYLKDKPITNASTSALGKIYADSLIGFGVNRGVELMSKRSKNPVYYYVLTYPGNTSVYHYQDVAYYFPSFGSNKNDEIIQTLTTLWANFAKVGNPTPQSTITVKWEPYNIISKKYLDIGKKLVMRSHIYERRYKFWRNLYPVSTYL